MSDMPTAYVDPGPTITTDSTSATGRMSGDVSNTTADELLIVGFRRGFAAAVAALIRAHHQHDLARAVLDDYGISLNDLDEASVDPWDMKHIRKVMP